MDNNISLSQYLRLESRQNEVKRQVLNGGLSMTNALAVTQDLLNSSRSAKQTPKWYVSPQLQAERMKTLLAKVGGDVASWIIPEIPDFVPRTSTEILMLAIYLPDSSQESGIIRTIRTLWREIIPPKSLVSRLAITEWNSVEKSLAQGIELIPEVKHQPGLHWVAFDPQANYNIFVESCWKDASIAPRLAGPEILAAGMLFPDWIGSWHGSHLPLPIMGAYQNHIGDGKIVSQSYMYIFASTLPSTSTSCPTVRRL